MATGLHSEAGGVTECIDNDVSSRGRRKAFGS